MRRSRTDFRSPGTSMPAPLTPTKRRTPAARIAAIRCGATSRCSVASPLRGPSADTTASAPATSLRTAVPSRASPTSQRTEEAVPGGAARVSAETSWPRRTSCSTTSRPVAPVAPSTATRTSVPFLRLVHVRYMLVDEPRGEDLQALDDALVRLRRLWTASRAHVLDDLGQRVEMSSVLVVEACARAQAGGGEASVGEVAAFLDVEPSTASRLVDRAVRAGLVGRTASEVDGRRSALVLTGTGHALRAKAVAARRGWLDDVVHDWSEPDLRSLAVALGRFADAIGAAAPPHARS